MTAQHAAQLPPQQNHRNGQGNQHAQPQVGKGIIIAVNLVLCGQHPTVQHAVYPHGVPQCIQVHAEIAVQCLPAAGSTAVQQPQCPAQQCRAAKVGSKVQAGPRKLAVVQCIFQQQRQRDGIGHRQKVGVDAYCQHVQHKQPAGGILPFAPCSKIKIECSQHKKLCPQRGMPEHTLKQNRTGNKQQVRCKRCRAPRQEQPCQQRTKTALQCKADQREPPHILERSAHKVGNRL